MDARLAPAVLAVLGGGVLIVLLFVPFVALSYRRRGGLTFWRTTGWATLVIYSLAIWTYTLLPFPETDEIVCRGPILNPMSSVQDVLRDAAAGASPLHNAAIQQLVLNVALFVPLGFLLRSMFRRGVIVALLTGFGLSLLIELTQLTGVWGLYSCAYRFFDVGDLITNTVGAGVGSLLAAVIVRERRTERPHPSAPRPITLGRRLLGMLVDWLAVTLLTGTISAVVALGAATLHHPLDTRGQNLLSVTVTLVVFLVQAAFVLGTGGTLGERAVLLTGVAGRMPAWIARPLRLLAGVGGYVILVGMDLSGWALLLLLANLIAVLGMRSRRGFAQWVSGLRVADTRTELSRGDRSPDDRSPDDRSPTRRVAAAQLPAPAAPPRDAHSDRDEHDQRGGRESSTGDRRAR